MTPDAVDGCSLWQFGHAVDGVITAKNGGQAPVSPPTFEEFDQAVLEDLMRS